MKFLILVISLLFLHKSSIAQFMFVGESLDSVYFYAWKADKDVIEDIDKNKEITLGWNDEAFLSTIYVYFKDGTTLSHKSCIVPNDNNALKMLINTFNHHQNIVKLTERKWKAYTNSHVYGIELLFVDKMNKNAFYILQIE